MPKKTVNAKVLREERRHQCTADRTLQSVISRKNIKLEVRNTTTDVSTLRNVWHNAMYENRTHHTIANTEEGTLISSSHCQGLGKFFSSSQCTPFTLSWGKRNVYKMNRSFTCLVNYPEKNGGEESQMNFLLYRQPPRRLVLFLKCHREGARILPVGERGYFPLLFLRFCVYLFSFRMLDASTHTPTTLSFINIFCTSKSEKSCHFFFFFFA